MSTKLYVGNLTYDTTETELRDLFSQAGTVSEAMLVNDKMTGRSRGFGFVTMSDADGAREASSRFNGSDFQGRSLIVNEAKERESHGSGGGGGGGGGGARRGSGKNSRSSQRY